jgi:hypothetical protein
VEGGVQINVHIKKGFRVFVLLLVTVLFFSCATTDNFERSYGGWIGQDASRLVGAWGKPTQEIPLPNGNTEYAYNLFRDPPPAAGCVVYYEVDKESRKIVHLRNFNYKEGRPCRRAPSCV